ncbi:hypothetical protein [Halorubrum ezzemoulense]|uniref:hypothetical protein n=1 Tax=Halorubrum ezzemoulense TaxID=337243 RepID=UPI002330B501|nr:hypothetical protein [Halorubrum ezzemoulense]MDB9254169.1 hypothetical protein [Halorubrum ezzemoulense]MDB9257305.1 hypothetical protein [Halorubrum ezzemoulense]MDB9277331.1 hypothetical protein [Halorubrum ezzemoulense]
MTDSDEKRDRNPWDDRYDHDDDDHDDAVPEDDLSTSETEETSNTADTSKSSKTSNRSETAKMSKNKMNAESSGTVRERKNVNMYLPETLVDDLQLRYSELNVKWRRQHGEDMPKNEEFYPAAVRAALGESSIEEELGLEE